MDREDYENSMDTVISLLTALGAGLMMWGFIRFLEGHRDGSRKGEIILAYYHRVDKIESRMRQLTRYFDTGKITEKRFLKRFTRYETELGDLHLELSGLDEDIKERKAEGLRLMMEGGGANAGSPYAAGFPV